MEQILCFDPVQDAEQFCKEKSALYLILPEENPTTFFLVSLFIQQFYREILSVADEYLSLIHIYLGAGGGLVASAVCLSA